MTSKNVKSHNGKQFVGPAKQVNVPSKVHGQKSGFKRDVAVSKSPAKGGK